LNNPVAYLVAQEASVDLSSNAIELRNEFPGEVKIDLIAKSLENTWFADEFPAESIRVPLSSSGDTFAILRSSESSVSLLGIASEQAGHTLLHYQSPIDLYRFPMQVGSAWSSTSAVIGTLASVPYNGTDAYETTVESISSVALPHLQFTSAYRVRTIITSDSGAAGVVVTRQQISMLSECFGEITRIVSRDNESASNFTTAAELWRFSL
ncbi:MAG: hypothetical protein JKY56_25595, partial [Kofleriaceae bacterium]|nr:hypothetical protein [Kofleriaceae bacterium]